MISFYFFFPNWERRVGIPARRSCWTTCGSCSATAASTTKKRRSSTRTPTRSRKFSSTRRASWASAAPFRPKTNGTRSPLLNSLCSSYLVGKSTKRFSFVFVVSSRRSRGPILTQKFKALYEAIKDFRDPKGRQLATIFMKLPSKLVRIALRSKRGVPSFSPG